MSQISNEAWLKWFSSIVKKLKQIYQVSQQVLDNNFVKYLEFQKLCTKGEKIREIVFTSISLQFDEFVSIFFYKILIL